MKNTTPSTTKRRPITLESLLPDLPGRVAPSATVGVVPKCRKDYPGFDQEVLVDLVTTHAAAEEAAAANKEGTPEWKAAMKSYCKSTDTVCRVVNLMLADAFEKGKKAQAAQQDSPAAAPASSPKADFEKDPNFQAWLAATTEATQRYAVNLPPSPADTLPVLQEKVQAFAVASSRFSKAPDRGKKADQAFAAVEAAEAELYAYIDELRDNARKGEKLRVQFAHQDQQKQEGGKK